LPISGFGLAQSRHSPERDQLLLRACGWYEKASEAAPAGLLKTKVEKRLADIASDVNMEAMPGSPDQPPLAVAPFDAKRAKLHQKRWSRYLHLPVVKTNSIGMPLVLIPPGEYEMGSTPEQVQWALAADAGRDRWYLDRVPTEAPRHSVKIAKPLYFAMYPVTQGEYEMVMGVNPSAFTEAQVDVSKSPLPEAGVKFRLDARQKMMGKDTRRHPVEMVSWDDATEFCRRLFDHASGAGCTAGLSVANRSGVGVCLPRGNDDPLVLRRRRSEPA